MHYILERLFLVLVHYFFLVNYQSLLYSIPIILSQLILISSSGYIADGYEGFNDFFLSYDKIIKEHIASGDWEEVQPARKDENMLFEDAAYTHVMRKLKK